MRRLIVATVSILIILIIWLTVSGSTPGILGFEFQNANDIHEQEAYSPLMTDGSEGNSFPDDTTVDTDTLNNLIFELNDQSWKTDSELSDFSADFGPIPDGMSLLFQEDFSEEILNPKIWNVVYQESVPNEELQTYHPQNVSISHGELLLTGTFDETTYNSGMIDTESKLTFTYGRIDIKMRLIDGTGFFPAVWLLFSDDSNLDTPYIEIDIMESLGEEPNRIYGVYHFADNNGNISTQSGEYIIDDALSYHVYSVDVRPDGISYLIDDQEYFHHSADVPEVPFYLIINLAIGGVWPEEPNESTLFPNSVGVDKLRILSYEDWR